MPLPPAYNPVYNLHVRLPEPSLHANPLIQTPPMLHLEGSHFVQWLMSDTRTLSSTVHGDSQRFALKDHDSGKLIPHLPVPLMAGPFLLETLHGSKYQILFHQPNVLLDGSPVGVFQWIIAPPWRCIEVKLPLPRFLAQAGRAGASRKIQKELHVARKERAIAERPLEVWNSADAAEEGAQANQLRAAAENQLGAALVKEGAAVDQERRRLAFLGFEARQRNSHGAAAEALETKREYDRLSRNERQEARRYESEAQAASERARQSRGSERARALAIATERRADAARARERSSAWEKGSEVQKAAARAQAQGAREERASWRRAEEERARARDKKKENPMQQATGESNAGLIAPSLFAHLPFPATVEIQVSWSQIGKIWIAGLVGAAGEALKHYVGFVFDGVLAPGRGKTATFLLDLVKSGINETLIDGGAKYLLEGQWPFKVSKKLGPVKASAQIERDAATGHWKWKATLEDKGDSGVLPAAQPRAAIEGTGFAPPTKATVEVHGKPIYEPGLTKPPVDYSHGVPAVN